MTHRVPVREDLARKSGYAYLTIVGLENAKRLPRSRTLLDWREALDMELTVRPEWQPTKTECLHL